MPDPTILVAFREGDLWEEVPLRLLRHRSFFDSVSAIRLSEKLIFDNVLFRQGESPFRLETREQKRPTQKLAFEDGET